MGLDMYAFSVEKNKANDTFEYAEGLETTELSYWRKFNALHGWMATKAETAGFDGSFNCVPYRLDTSDLNELEEDLDNLTPTEGFFFGSPEIHPEDIKQTQEFIVEARKAIANNRDVYYDSWW